MNKSERINDLLFYLNDKNYFNLKDIMDKYNISRSTALRDIESLEKIGMPIYSELGRNGRYGILKNKLLSPIIFTVDEMYALYFSMITLNAYESTPFHLKIPKLKEKFKLCLSENQINNIIKLESILTFEATKHNNSSPLLKNILKSSIEEKVSSITYNKKDSFKNYSVQFFNITSKYGQWYSTALNLSTNQFQVFRCDKISRIKVDSNYNGKPIEDLISSYNNKFSKNSSSVEFEVHINENAIDLFYKENYPSMNLVFENDKYIIKGFYNPVEENFISSYFINFGNSILKIKPEKLKILIINKLSSLNNHYNSL